MSLCFQIKSSHLNEVYIVLQDSTLTASLDFFLLCIIFVFFVEPHELSNFRSLKGTHFPLSGSLLAWIPFLTCGEVILYYSNDYGLPALESVLTIY